MSKIIIDSNKRSFGLNLKELIEYKDLFWILAYRDIKVRYAQSYLGFLWTIVQPVMTLAIFTIVFSKTINVNTQGIPYPIFALSGMIAWTYFSFVINQSGSSVITSQNIVTKVYFPRLIIPLSKSIVGFIDFVIVFILMLFLMLLYQTTPSVQLVMLPVFIVLTIVASLGVGIWLSALSVRYRDFQTIIPFLLQFGLYASPIAYSTSIIREEYRILFYLNPMTGIIEGFRWCFLGIDPPSMLSGISYGIAIILFVSGLLYFKKVERVMADLI